jgi:hypothetical protein
MIHLPARKVRAADLPVLALAVRCQDERAFPRADQNSYVACSFISSRLDRPLFSSSFQADSFCYAREQRPAFAEENRVDDDTVLIDQP